LFWFSGGGGITRIRSPLQEKVLRVEALARCVELETEPHECTVNNYSVVFNELHMTAM
jgi:hypothetical protein